MAKNTNSKNQMQNSGTNCHDSVQNVSTKSKNKNSSKSSNCSDSSKNSGMENTHTSNAYSAYNEEE